MSIFSQINQIVLTVLERINTKSFTAFVFGLCIIPSLTLGTFEVSAQTAVEKLQQQIEDKNSRLGDIEAEIAKFESALQEVGAEKSTLQGAINKLELERRKVQGDISYTENKISSTDLQINKLTLEIGDTSESIDSNEAAIAEIIRAINLADNDTFVEVLLSHENLSEFWNEIESLETVKYSMSEQVRRLSELRDLLDNKRGNETEKREELTTLQKQYSGQKSVLENNKAEKSNLLSATRNEERTYQQLLEDQKTARETLIAEVRDIESQLKFILDPNTIPAAGSGVFNWPLKNPYITQYFGYTKFALTTAAYKGGLHNGMDLGAPTGTNIYAPLGGTVRNVGNTDAVPGCYSWGKWVLIDHPNGLSTMYAHLSHIGVSNGQSVSTGEIIGYVGNTGYSTGPHLHFTLYVSDGVQVMPFNQFKAVTGCGAAQSPFAAVEAYLDPLDYLRPL